MDQALNRHICTACTACTRHFFQSPDEEPLSLCPRCFCAASQVQIARVEAAYDAYLLARLRGAIAATAKLKEGTHV